MIDECYLKYFCNVDITIHNILRLYRLSACMGSQIVLGFLLFFLMNLSASTSVGVLEYGNSPTLVLCAWFLHLLCQKSHIRYFITVGLDIGSYLETHRKFGFSTQEKGKVLTMNSIQARIARSLDREFVVNVSTVCLP